MIKVSVLGFDSRSTHALNTTLGNKSGKTIEVTDVVSAEATDVVLIDMDGTNATMLWDGFRHKWPDIPAVVISINPVDIENTLYINKPFKLDALIDTIKQAVTKASSATTKPTEQNRPNLKGVASKLSTHSTSDNSLALRKLDALSKDELYFNPEAHILGLVIKGVEETRKNATIGKIKCLLNKILLIDANSQRIYSTLTDIEMRQIAIVPLGTGENGLDTKLEIVKSFSPRERLLLIDPNTRVYTIDKFVWELAVLTSKGRVPEGTPMDQPTYLMQWPNFTRLAHIPHAMRVAAYWVKQTSSLIELTGNLDVPLKDVLGFYAAATAINLAGVARRQEDSLIMPVAPEKHKHRKFFNSVIGNIRNKISDIRENK